MPHWIILNKATGRHVSESSTPLDGLPEHLEVVEIAERPRYATEEWDVVQRKLVAKPAAAKPLAYLKGLTTLSAEQRDAVLLALVDHFKLRDEGR